MHSWNRRIPENNIKYNVTIICALSLIERADLIPNAPVDDTKNEKKMSKNTAVYLNIFLYLGSLSA